jgi:hypothetical protein
MYGVITAPTINIFHQDLVMCGSTGVATPKLGTIMAIEDANIVPATPGDASPLLGSVLAIYDENFDPISYIAATRVGNGTIAGYVLVADHPDQLFEAQEDADTTPIAAASVGLNVDVYSPALSLGNTGSGVGKQEIDSSSVAVTATLALHLVGMAHPETDSITAVAATQAGCRWIVTINAHQYGRNFAKV